MHTIRMTEDEWFDQFAPVASPYSDLGWRHCLHDTAGAGYALVQVELARGDNRIWTLLDCDGQLVIVNGWHYVNRQGYFITTYPAAPETEYEVYDPDQEQLDG
jgi:hypothetical protein